MDQALTVTEIPISSVSDSVFISFLIIICKIKTQAYYLPSWHKTLCFFLFFFVSLALSLCTQPAFSQPQVRKEVVKKRAVEWHKEWWEVRSHWCVSWDEECLKLSHVKCCAGVACGGYHPSICWWVGGISIDCRSMALRSNWKANIVQHIPWITSYCSNKYAILLCLFLVRLCCSH